MRDLLRLAILLPLLSTGFVSAQTPRLVADINTLPAGDASSNPHPGLSYLDYERPSRFVTIGRYTYFAATTPEFGMEIYRTTGGGKPVRLTDTNPGFRDSNPSYLTALGTKLFFHAIGKDVGAELWVIETASASPSPKLLKDINPGTAFSYVEDMQPYKGKVYFAAQSPGSGSELWSSDGTPAGTKLVKDIWPGVGYSHPHDFAVVNGKLLFLADDGKSGDEMWVSDGTSAGTRKAGDLFPGTGWVHFPSRIAFKNELYFTVHSLKTGGVRGVWKTDGTAAGTKLVHDLLIYGPLVLARNELYFPAEVPNLGSELCKTDGTKLTVFDIWSGSRSSSPFELTAMGRAPNELVIFTAAELSSRIFVCDGTKVTGIGIRGTGFVRVPTGEVYYNGDGELWKSDGTATGTRLIKDINTTGVGKDSNPTYLTVDPSGGVLFAADDGVNGVEPWRTDGTAAGTRLVHDITTRAPTGDSSPEHLVEADGVLYFSAVDHRGRELWRSDGTAAGTTIVAELPGWPSLRPESLTVVGDKLFFTGISSHPSGERELYSLDLRTGKLTEIDVRRGRIGSRPTELVGYKGRLYFQANGDLAPGPRPLSGAELWSSDGTVAGTRLVKDIRPGDASPQHLVRVGAKLYFAADDGVHGVELWETDGTSAGTRMVVDLRKGSPGSDPKHLTDLHGQLVFAATSPANGRELYVSDGTPAGTRLIDVRRGVSSSNAQPGGRARFAVSGPLLYFTCDDGVHGWELWRTDGTVAGTKLTRDVASGSASSIPYLPIRFGDGVLFRAMDGFAAPGLGMELWRSDGTAAGTVLVKDIFAGGKGWTSSNPKEFANAGSRQAVFAAIDHVSGYDPWITDGTEAGTRRIQMGPWGADVRNFTLVNGTVFYSAKKRAAGRELWAFDVGAATKRYGTGCSAENGIAKFDATDPVLGKPFVLSVRDAPAGKAGMALVGVRATGPKLWSFPGGCTSYIDLTISSLPIPFATDANGSWSLMLPVPNDPKFIGATVPVQAAIGPTATWPLGHDLTNLLVLTAGH